MARERERKGPTRGFTLIEVGISLGILVVLLIAVGRVVLAGSRAFRAGSARNAVVMKARRALDRIADELTMAGLGNMTPVPTFPNYCSGLDVSTPTGLVGGTVQFGSVTRILLRPDPADPVNGADDDGDGLVDEGFVECTKDVGLPSQRTVVLCDDVALFAEGEVGGNGLDDNGNGLADERGLSFVLTSERLTIGLTVVGLDAEQRVIRQTVGTSIKIRN
jgi:hypothetical protein